jgi:hypothetical protein
MANFNANQRRALLGLLQCPTIRAAADFADITEKTIHKYLKDADFKAELRALQDRTINAASAALSGLTGKALGVLDDTLDDKKATRATRVRAALGILDCLIKVSTFADLEERIAALEARSGVR